MKIIYTLFLFLSFQNLISQVTDGQSAEISERIYEFNEVDVSAKFPGGIEKFYKYFMKNFVSPEERTPGKLLLSFVVDSSGSIKDIKVVKNQVDPEFAIEAIRILKMSPKWIPAEKDGKKVSMMLSLPLNS